MGKRSNFERRERDYYPTPAAAIPALLAHLPRRVRFIEPCAGNGALVDHLTAGGYHVCAGAYDLEPQRADIAKRDALTITAKDTKNTMLVTNPPHSWTLLRPLIEHFTDIATVTWLLLDADIVHNLRFAQFLPRLRRVVSIGRLRWIPGSEHTSKQNAIWCSFTRPSAAPTLFYGRQER